MKATTCFYPSPDAAAFLRSTGSDPLTGLTGGTERKADQAETFLKRIHIPGMRRFGASAG